ncbi:hypothetical protein EC973_006309 [Apophysomyces ossiformis]|uniref:Cysteine dioxygenase n=1 Tax=Apophysomyces ossiformis TaxID=679940 RepID=A0A8H7EP34_9FUNG|nr:hypothetical protein EC973_006309 [Apophysomyces ossiformis]
MAPPQEPLTVTEAYDNTDVVYPLPPVQDKKDNSSFTLKDLIREIHNVLGPDGGLDSEHIDANEIIRLMERYSSNADDWNQYTMFDHSRAYTRNLIDSGNGKFNLMILAWSKGQQSPIHNHSGSHCIMKILDGELQETLYDWPEQEVEEESAGPADITEAAEEKSNNLVGANPLHVSKDTMYHPNECTYVHDKIGLHRISNPSKQRGAVSLHLYTPPYQMCKTFEEKTGRARSSGICSFYSVGGTRCKESL